MRQIRKGVFETNSSSMHSLVIRNENTFEENENQYYPKEEIINELKWFTRKDESVLDLSNEELYFGRAPFRILDSFFTKFEYALANRYKNSDLISILNKFMPEIKKIKTPKDGWIGTDDYQLKGWLKKENISLEEFLTSSKYVVICDGDEYCIWEDMKNSGIIDMKAFKEKE